MDDAACKGHDPEIWFTSAWQHRAVAICTTCPVQNQCANLAQAIRPGYGIWAGVLHDSDIYRSPMAYRKEATP